MRKLNNNKLVFIYFLVIFFFSLNPKQTFAVDINLINNNNESYIYYDDYGAVGDGKTNDYEAIKKAHDAANKIFINEGVMPTVFPCKEKDCSNKTYYMSSGSSEIKVITNIDWKKANFIIDDYVDSDSDGVNDIKTTNNLFAIITPLKIDSGVNYVSYNNEVISNLNDSMLIKPGTTNLIELIDAFYERKIDTNKYDRVKKYFDNSSRWLIEVKNSNKQFIRKGSNANSGHVQSEVILLDSLTGEVLSDINWIYDDITSIIVYPIPNEKIKIGNGNFTTYTDNMVFINGSESGYLNRGITTYYSGNIELYKINHFLKENEHPYTSAYQTVSNGNKYYGFFKFLTSSYINVNNCSLAPHTPVNLVSNGKITNSYIGTYDIILENTINIFLDKVVYSCNIYNSDGSIDYNTCYRQNMINENKWGIMASNKSKNVFITNSKLNRIDAHRNITNLYVADSTIGVGNSLSSLTLIGKGYFYGKNLKIDSANRLLSLRNDYGSTWDGTMVFDNIDFVVNKNSTNPVIVYSNNEENHDFGYDTYFPNIYFNNLNIDTTTKGANNVKNVTFLELSSLYNNSSGTLTVDKTNPRNLYKFKGNIYLNNLNTNGNTFNLFSTNFTNLGTNTYNKNNYGGTNVVNMFLDNDVIVDTKLSLEKNSKFKQINSMDSKIDEVALFFNKLINESKNLNSKVIFDEIIKVDKENQNLKIKSNELNVNNFINMIDTDNEINIINKDGVLVDNTEIICSGYKLKIKLSNNELTYKIIILGDVNGDGKISIADVAKLYQKYKNKIEFEEDFIIAGDLVEDNSIEITDIDELYEYVRNN